MMSTSRESCIIRPENEAILNDDEEQKERLNVFLPPEVWYNVLGRIPRLQRATGASLACRKFHILCQGQDVKTLSPLEFHPNQCHNKNNPYRRKLQGWDAMNTVPVQLRKVLVDPNSHDSVVVPIAEIPPPKYITDFKQIKLFHFNQQVANFLQLIKHIFTKLKLYIILQLDPNMPALDFIITMLLNNSEQPDTTFSLVVDCILDSNSRILDLFERFPEAFERKIQTFAFTTSALDEHYRLGRSREEANAELDLLVGWLCASPPLKNGKPRALGLLRCISPAVNRLIDRIRERFLKASEPAHFLIRLEILLRNWSYNEFTLVNTRTKERLEMRKKDPYNWILRRCPIDWNEKDDPSERELLDLRHRPNTWEDSLTSKNNQCIYMDLNRYQRG